MRTLPESPDILLITLDALRYDVAEMAWQENRCQNLKAILPYGWEKRHSPGNFTFAAHAAIFAGFWPTPATPQSYTRPFALEFPGSKTIGKSTLVLQGDNIIHGFSRLGYKTICIGGVGFFNKQTPLGSLFPGYFEESYWEPIYGVTSKNSTHAQCKKAIQIINNQHADQALLIFLNVSATHPPTHIFTADDDKDSLATQLAALAYADVHLGTLLEALKHRPRPGIGYIFSDHGTMFGEDNWHGHRIGHPHVWEIPYGEFSWRPQAC